MMDKQQDIVSKNGIKVKRKPLEATVCKYEVGLEDGFATFVDVVTNAHIFSDSIVKIDENGIIKCPYVNNKRGRTFINENDYIIFEADGGKHVVSSENLWNRFEK